VFSAEGVPLSIVVLIDDDLKSGDAREMAPSLRAILAGIRASDEAAIGRFDVEFYAGEGFTGNADPPTAVRQRRRWTTRYMLRRKCLRNAGGKGATSC
jgi:hypothetical protein